MPSTAISAQGSTFEISSGAGSAKTITGMAPGNPTIVTSTAHGLTNGTVVAIASVTGTIGASVNGKSYVVRNVTTNTFAIEENTTGLAYTSGGTATPASYTAVANVKSFQGLDGEAGEIDVTNLSSVAKEFRAGLQDFGAFSLEWDPDYADAGQNAMRAAQASGAVKDFRLTLPNATVVSFSAIVKNAQSISGGVDAVLNGSVALKISGAVSIV